MRFTGEQFAFFDEAARFDLMRAKWGRLLVRVLYRYAVASRRSIDGRASIGPHRISVDGEV